MLFSVRLKNRKKMEGVCSGHMLKVGSYQCHRGLKEIKINQSGSLTNAEVKSGKGREKGFFLQQSSGAVRNEN